MNKIIDYLISYSILLIFLASSVSADKLCLKVSLNQSTNKVRTVKQIASTCPRGFVELVDINSFTGETGQQGLKGDKGEQGIQGVTGPKGDKGDKGEQGIQGVTGPKGDKGEQGLQGTTGIQGNSGIDGSIRVFGDGSAGDLIVNSTVNLDESNLQFNNISILPGGSLTVSSGTILRCAGNFTNYNSGTLIVDTNSLGANARRLLTDVDTLDRGGNVASPSFNNQIASNGEVVNQLNVLAQGGFSGQSLTSSQAKLILKTSLVGGGGGGIGFRNDNIQNYAGRGGGSLTILCRGNIYNHGLIIADGENGMHGAGGGGGGLIILASKESILNSINGSISARGGNGGEALGGGLPAGAGGGGGGGLVHMISTIQANNSGNITVSGGNGSSAIQILGGSLPRHGGGAGGSSVGGGGAGGDIPSGNTVSSTASSGGEVGLIVITTTDPTSML